MSYELNIDEDCDPSPRDETRLRPGFQRYGDHNIPAEILEDMANWLSPYSSKAAVWTHPSFPSLTYSRKMKSEVFLSSGDITKEFRRVPIQAKV